MKQSLPSQRQSTSEAWLLEGRQRFLALPEQLPGKKGLQLWLWLWLRSSSQGASSALPPAGECGGLFCFSLRATAAPPAKPTAQPFPLSSPEAFRSFPSRRRHTQGSARPSHPQLPKPGSVFLLIRAASSLGLLRCRPPFALRFHHASPGSKS